jgi:hypothetical protein
MNLFEKPIKKAGQGPAPFLSTSLENTKLIIYIPDHAF